MFVRHVLELHHHLVVAAASAEEALAILQERHAQLSPDALLVDSEALLTVLSPGWRKHWPDSLRQPVLVIDEGYELNLPDSVLTVSAQPRELLLKLKSVLKHNPAQDQVLERQGLRLDPATQEAQAGHLRLNLTPLAFRLLYFLMKNPGRVYTREQLLDHVWRDQGFVEERTVDVHIYRLRNQLDRYGYGELIEAVRGSGYRFAPEVQAPAKKSGDSLRFAS